MTTEGRIIIGLVVVVLVVVSIAAFAKPKDKGIIVDPGNGQPPIKCKENDPGWEILGNGEYKQNPLCGVIKCDNSRPGYNLNGFPDPECGFGRIGQRR